MHPNLGSYLFPECTCLREECTLRSKIRFVQHREELRLLFEFIHGQELKRKKSLISYNFKDTEICEECLAILISLTRTDKLESYFGVHVLLDELDHFFNNSISKMKLFLKNYTINMSFKNSSMLLKSLKKDLLAISFLKFDESSHISSKNSVFLGKTMTAPISYDELVKYYTIGTALMNDPTTVLLLKELRRLRSESTDISPFSVIIGPSYKGKTQAAFTLANIINVIYVNFVSTTARNPQPIYMLFSLLADRFKTAIRADKHRANQSTRAKDILSLEFSFQTLGLIYLIIRTRKIRADLDGLVWLKELVSINEIMIPPMTLLEFLSKTEGISYFILYFHSLFLDIDLGNQLLFIDELPRNNAEISSSIEFLRNLSRAIRLPVNISNTNSQIRNMIEIYNESGSRSGDLDKYTWVQVTVKTPQSSLKTFAHLIKFKPHNSNISTSCLKDFIQPRTNNLNYAQLFRSLFGTVDTNILNRIAPVKKLIGFLLEQSKTCLPGINLLIFSKLFEILPKFTDLKTLWGNLALIVIEEVTKRKKSLKSYSGLNFGAHILTFISPQKKSLEIGWFSSILVDKHFFRYSSMSDDTFRLDLSLDEGFFEDDEPEPCFLRDGKDYDDSCYFPELSEDFFTSFISFGVWNSFVLERENGLRSCTLATIYEKYLVNLNTLHVDSDAIVTDSFKLELLAHWSICYASHVNLNGETNGNELFLEFVKNIQNLNKQHHKKLQPVRLNGLNNLPVSLKSILNRIEVPFLVRFPTKEEEKKMSIKSLTKILGIS